MRHATPVHCHAKFMQSNGGVHFGGVFGRLSLVSSRGRCKNWANKVIQCEKKCHFAENMNDEREGTLPPRDSYADLPL